MRLDPEDLRQHYASLSDEALHEVDRGDLVDVARACYDEEMAAREIRSPDAPQQDEEAPDWLDESAEVFSVYIHPGQTGAPEAEEARNALTAAGIPCYLNVQEELPRTDTGPAPTHRWRLTVPGNMNLQAASVLDRDIFNHDFDDTWRTHLQMLSNEDLRASDPEKVFCGLFDRIQRVTRAYEEEIARRGLK